MEDDRLRSLIATGLLDTDAEERFDRITRLASNSLGMPIALVSFIDAERQWFKSRIGLDAAETPRSISFCDHAIRKPDDLTIIFDASKDERFRDNPLVTGEPRVAFYAGAPLVTKDGHAIGTLCVIDHEPRTEFSDREQAILKDLANSVMAEIEAAAGERELDDLTLINRELQHRMGNLYSQVASVVALLGKSEADVKTFMEKLNENIRSMSKVHSLFAANKYNQIAFSDLVNNALSPYSPAFGSGRIQVDDDFELVVSERGAFLLTLVLNELATNSTKYGALSRDVGSISLKTNRDNLVTIDWNEDFERGELTEDMGEGFGTRILRDIAPRGLGGTAEIEFGPLGFSYRLSADPKILGSLT